MGVGSIGGLAVLGNRGAGNRRGEAGVGVCQIHLRRTRSAIEAARFR